MKFSRSLRKWGWLLALPVAVLFWQNCSNVRLQELGEIEFLSISSSPFRLDPPLEYEQPRRIIFFVDMSQSMVSGQCVQDLDSALFDTSPFEVWDPNKETGNYDDHRGSGADCKINPALPIARSSVANRRINLLANPPVTLETHLGVDHEGNRLKMLYNWIIQAQANPVAVVNSTKVMVVPISGGISQRKLNEAWTKLTGKPTPIRFYDVTDPELVNVINWMWEEHQRNLTLSKSDDEWRYETRTMGSTAPGARLRELYQSIADDMRSLNEQGLLTFAQYQFMHVSDGFLTPVKKHISDGLKFYATCSACADNPETCQGVCGSLVKRMTDAWGEGTDNELEKLDFYYGLMQSLPYYFGSGYLRIDFVQLQKSRVQAVYPSEKPYFEKIKPLFDKRSARMAIWNAESETPPFRLVGDATQASTYQITDMFVLNANVRLNKKGQPTVDSDGDGLFDEEERTGETSPTMQRTNSYCLDSFIVDAAFKERCLSMASAKTCDPTLDTDGDSLNECEESLLGSNPFDFDTDDDGLPDSLEWIYGYNALVSDTELDANGDGYLNKNNFASGLSPEHYLKQLSPEHLMQYETNSQGKETISIPTRPEISVELYELIVHNMTSANGTPIPPATLPPLYLSRVGTNKLAQEKNLIPYNHRLLSVIDSANRNTLIALARMVDISNPERAYWRFYKTSVPTTNQFKQPRLDLSLFQLLKTNDRTE